MKPTYLRSFTECVIITLSPPLDINAVRQVAEVETSLLKTKLNIPPARPQMVPRPRLIERLKEGLSYNLILVSAPAGFGKTTLLSEWTRISQPQVRTAWVSLDEGDNDPVRFWDYLIAALQTLQRGYGEKILPWLHSSHLPSTESMLTAMINELSIVKGDFVIVLDDYHLIASQQIHDGITYLLEHLPAQIHLVIATRADPPLPLARLRGKGMMLEIHTDDLRFTQDETASLLKELKTPAFNAKDIVALDERTEGWVVGLKMAALSIRGQKDVPGFIAAFTGSQRYIMDYLMEEVLQRQSVELRDFLTKTSVLRRLTAPLCDVLTGRRDSQDILLNLERDHLFIMPLDETRQWYRYEHLFADLLRHQCEMVYGTEQVTALHLLASQWYEDNDLHDEAIYHTLAARDWERAAKLITKAADELIKRGEWNTLSDWFQAVPEEVLRAHPLAYAHYANILVTGGKLEAAETVLAYLGRMPNLQEGLRGQLTFFRMEIAYRRGDVKRSLELGERALDQLTEEYGATRARILHIMGVFDGVAGRLDKAQSREAEALRTARLIGESWVAATAAGNLCLILLHRGKLRQAVTAGQQAVDLAAQSPAPTGAGAYVGFAQVLYERNELEGAAHNSRLAIKMGELSGYSEELIMPCYYLAQTLLASEDIDGAEEVMEKGDEASRRQSISPLFRAFHAAHRVMFAVQCGDIAAAVDWSNQLSEFPFDDLIYFQHFPARLLIARGDNAAAAEQLRDLYEWAMQADAQGLAIRIRVYQAIAAATQDEAIGFLTQALKMGQPEGFTRTFVDEGSLLAPLLQQAIHSGIESDYARKLLTIIEAEDRQHQIRKGQIPVTPFAASILSEREMEVLRLLAAGLSDRQIATKLVVSLGTAKTHVHRILGKLNATSRTHAVTQARELKII
jgi:LuxR family maltose regulon positive regulatory protein